MKKIITDLIKENKLSSIQDILSRYNPIDLAEMLEDFKDKDLAIIFRTLTKVKAAEVFAYMPIQQQERLVSIFTDEDIGGIFDNLYADDSVDFLENMPSNVVNRILKNIDKTKRDNINNLLQYDKDSAGSIMTVEYATANKDMTVKEVIHKIRHEQIDSETIYTGYVLESRKLIGIITGRDLLLRNSDEIIGDFYCENYVSVHVNDDKEKVAHLLKKYRLIAIPVLDNENCMVRIITFDDIMSVLEDETTEDIHKMAAINSRGEEYLTTSTWTHAKHRIVWLLVLMFSASITGIIISKYEHAFAAVPLLVSFIPMLMDTGGNCGSQSSTLIVRGLSVGELETKDFLKIFFKEFKVSILVGFVLGVLNGIRIYFMYRDVNLAITVSVTLIFTIIISKLIGCTLPIIAQKLNLDPAIMAAPLITTIVDTTSIILYFKFATLIFGL
ncbi:MAG: magnesium transporter [Oscillospiraceae bacterium]